MKEIEARDQADSTRRPKVLVVDDDASTRLMAREILGSAGFVVEEADGGQRGLGLVESFCPDVVLLDIVMPGMDGFDTLKSLRKLGPGSDCAVVMVTGLQDPGSVELAYELGATDFVTKPINWSLLRHRLNYVLRSSMERRAGDEHNLDHLENKLHELQASARQIQEQIQDLLDPFSREEGGEDL